MADTDEPPNKKQKLDPDENAEEADLVEKQASFKIEILNSCSFVLDAMHQ